MISSQCETKTFWFVVDVSDERKVEEAASQVRGKIGDIDILVNNAVSVFFCFESFEFVYIFLFAQGIAPCEPFKELTSEKIRRVFDVNILAHFWVRIVLFVSGGGMYLGTVSLRIFFSRLL